ncbi:hypothetical protein [Streptomyces erythrochromogenes]|uniref:hypothetical protein n=1 Tax=Streptomyces erythrochromogenes TaxID=285574 RepID=UPI00380B23C8
MTHARSDSGLLRRSLALACTAAALIGAPAWAAPDGSKPHRETARAWVSDSDLEVVRLDPDPAAAGGTTTLHAFISNQGPETTGSPFTVVVTLPRGVTPEGPYFPTSCAPGPLKRQVRCVFPAGLNVYQSATALIPIRLDTHLSPGTVFTGGSVTVRSIDDLHHRGNNQNSFNVQVSHHS